MTDFAKQIAAQDYTKYARLQVVVAYAKLSGVHLLIPHLTSFRAKGGEVEIVVGISQKNTSKEAIEELNGVGASVAIFHNPGSLQRTFHPKAYLLSGPEVAWSSVGSSNLTRGGLDTNYEWNSILGYDLTIAGDAARFAQLQTAFASLQPPNPSAKVATTALIAELHKRGALPSESELQKKTMKAAKQEKDDKLTDLFGKQKLPEPVSKATKVAAKSTKTSASPTAIAPPTLAAGFWKRLSAWDVSPTSSPGQILIPKDAWKYFPALGDPEIKPSGAAQADTYFDVIYQDENGNKQYVSNVRRISYPPAPGHARTNEENRFTFLNDAIFDSLVKGDVLEFRRMPSGGAWFEITRVPKKIADATHAAGASGIF